jgi:hypothetical protein
MALLLRIAVDREIVNIISTISGNAIREVDMAFSMPANHPSIAELPIDEFTMTPADQTDHEMNDRIEALPSPSHNLALLCSDNESDHEHKVPWILWLNMIIQFHPIISEKVKLPIMKYPPIRPLTLTTHDREMKPSIWNVCTTIYQGP